MPSENEGFFLKNENPILKRKWWPTSKFFVRFLRAFFGPHPKAEMGPNFSFWCVNFKKWWQWKVWWIIICRLGWAGIIWTTGQFSKYLPFLQLLNRDQIIFIETSQTIQGPHSPTTVPPQVFPGHFPGRFSPISRFLSLRGSAKSAIFQVFPGWISEAISQIFSFFPSAN